MGFENVPCEKSQVMYFRGQDRLFAPQLSHVCPYMQCNYFESSLIVRSKVHQTMELLRSATSMCIDTQSSPLRIALCTGQLG